MKDKILQLVIGGVCLAIVWILILPLLTGVVHTLAAVVIAIVAIVWLLWVGGIIS